MIFVISRFGYILGYKNGGPKGRTIPFTMGLLGGFFPLIALLGYTAYETFPGFS